MPRSRHRHAVDLCSSPAALRELAACGGARDRRSPEPVVKPHHADDRALIGRQRVVAQLGAEIAGAPIRNDFTSVMAGVAPTRPLAPTTTILMSSSCLVLRSVGAASM